MPEVRLAGHPYMRIGTPAHTGPYSRLRGNYLVWLEQGAAAWPLIVGGRGSVRQAAQLLGLSPTTAWRRAWWFHDWIVLPGYYGLERGPVPHQRGTRAVPNGRPVLAHDAREIFRELLDSGYCLADIIGSRRVVPKNIRDLAVEQLAELAPIAEEFPDFTTAERLELAREDPALYRDLVYLTGSDTDRWRLEASVTYRW